MRPIEAKAISAIRVLSADTVQKANSGHPGMPIGARPPRMPYGATCAMTLSTPTGPAGTDSSFLPAMRPACFIPCFIFTAMV